MWEEYAVCDIMNLCKKEITVIRESEFINCSREVLEKEEARKITMSLMGYDKEELEGYDTAIKSEKELEKTKFKLYLVEVAVSDGNVFNIEGAPEKYCGLAGVVCLKAREFLKPKFQTAFNQSMLLLLCELHLFSLSNFGFFESIFIFFISKQKLKNKK